MTTKEQIAVMKAFAEGKPIEVSCRLSLNREWEDVKPGVEPSWDWMFFDYRIKDTRKFMTKRQLTEWVSRGNGVYRTSNDVISNIFHYAEREENVELKDGELLIRRFGSDKWIKPLYQIYKQDCGKPTVSVL